jgi:hypothetical protein
VVSLDQFTHAYGTSRSAIIQLALREYFDRQFRRRRAGSS